ncbi:MAG: MFS transporter, partial [Micrococcaceae bacterium]|nr:MFS transporter [Micrococcaceae bacterium]
MLSEDSPLDPGHSDPAGSTVVRDDRLDPAAKMTIGVLLVSAFVVILNETIMNVALPRLMVAFDVSADAVQW